MVKLLLLRCLLQSLLTVIAGPQGMLDIHFNGRLCVRLSFFQDFMCVSVRSNWADSLAWPYRCHVPHGPLGTALGGRGQAVRMSTTEPFSAATVPQLVAHPSQPP